MPGAATTCELHTTSRHNQLHPVVPPHLSHFMQVPFRTKVKFASWLRSRGACDKRQFLRTMDPDVIRSIKQAALDLDRTASDIMEEAGKQWLQSKTKKG
jgi:hypothetical protein